MIFLTVHCTQIRKMVGTALCVMMGKLELDLLRASLSRHARVALPLAPPDGLVLFSCEFYPFRGQQTKAEVEDGHSPRAVELSLRAVKESHAFFEEQILPCILSRMDCQDDPWLSWVHALEGFEIVPVEEGEALLKCWRQWKQERELNQEFTSESEDLIQLN